MAQLYRHLFKVTSRHPLSRVFPLDMLRYDHCIPATSEDVTKIIDTLEGYTELKDLTEGDEITIELSAYWEKPYTPTAERWKSFGWQVVIDSLETQKM